MNRFVWLLALLMTACAPVVYVTPGTGDVLLPEEAQRALDSYTATARSMATQSALATATGVAARETATAAAQGTLGALGARQTTVALEITQGAAFAAATDVSGAKTQAAGQTQAWATPTMSAMRTQAALVATQAGRQAASAESAAEFWKSLRFIVLALLIVGGLTAIAVVTIASLARVKVATLASQAAVARDAFRLLPPGHWAEWEAGQGYQVYPLPGLLDEPATIIENAAATPNRAHALRHAVRLFAWWGDRFGFGIRDLGPAGTKVVTDPVYRKLAGMLRGAGVLADVVVDGQQKTGWAPEWGYTRFADELSKGRLVLPPLLEEEDVPKVAYTVPTQHHS